MQIEQKTDDLKRVEKERDEASENIAELTKKRDTIMAQWKAEKAIELEASGTCPTCGQQIPQEQIAEKKKLFEAQKRQKLTELSEKGQKTCSKSMIEAEKDRESYKNEKIAQLQAEIKILETEKAAIEKPEIIDFKQTEAYSKLCEEAEKLKALREDDGGASQEESPKAEEIMQLRKELAACKNTLVEIEQNKRLTKRTKELEAEEKQLNTTKERLEEMLYLAESFIIAKVELIKQEINGLFKSVQFKLFETQINGAIKEVCEVLVPSDSGLVPFTSANNAGKINAGIEIINILSKHWDVQIPIIVDNAESVTRLADSSSQIIKLTVDENCKELKIEGVE